jgi:hypothetical protein
LNHKTKNFKLSRGERLNIPINLSYLGLLFVLDFGFWFNSSTREQTLALVSAYITSAIFQG